MNKYESIVIINPNLTEEENKEVIEKIENLIKSNGNLEETEILGKKRLAYEIRKFSEGYYVLFNFESESEFIIELERNYRIIDEVIKFIVVRKDYE